MRARVCVDPRPVMEFSRVSNRQFQIYRVHSKVRTSPSYRTFQLSAESEAFYRFFDLEIVRQAWPRVEQG